MLYEQWRRVSGEKPGELALLEVASGRRWTFAELAHEAEQFSVPAGELVCPQGSTALFITQTLAAWRAGCPLCPLEQGQPAPRVARMPPGCVHFKITSATSGAPKLIAFTATQLLADAANIVSTMGLRAECPNLAAISLAHSYGFSNLVLPLLLFGVPLILVPAPLPELVRRAASLVPKVTIASVPALWKTWHEGGGFPENVALAISAGAPLPLSLEESVLATRGVKIHNFYGSSECGGIAYDRTTTLRNDPACAGSALDGVRLGITSAGTLAIESQAVGQTYWPEPSALLGGGRFETSDLAELRDGQVFLKGRAGDVINVAGRKVSPETIEAVLRLHPAIRECVVFGVPDTQDGRFEKIIGCVAPRGRQEIAALSAFLSEKLPPWQIPRRWWFVDALAANERGKISRAEWRKLFLEQTTSERKPNR